MLSKQWIVVNGFRFCHHGHEQCPVLCRCDHRMDNNLHLEREWPGVEFPDFELEVSTHLSPLSLWTMR